MKTLERFWHWVDTERPGALGAAHHCHRDDGKGQRVQDISDVGLDALEAASLLITFRTRGKVVSQPWNRVYYCLEHHRRQLRELSLGIALDVNLAYAALPAPAPETPEPTFDQMVAKARNTTPAPHRPQCVGCGLFAGIAHPHEPSVCKRPDGQYRCNDCQKARSIADSKLAQPGQATCTCGMTYAPVLVKCPRCNRLTCLNAPKSIPTKTAIERLREEANALIGPPVDMATPNDYGGPYVECRRCWHPEPRGAMSCTRCGVSFLYVAVPSQ